MMYQYFVKIVPTVYVKTDGEVRPTLVDLWGKTVARQFLFRFKSSSHKSYCDVAAPGGENQPVLRHQTREGGQRADRRPGSAGRLHFIRAFTNDGEIHREAQVKRSRPASDVLLLLLLNKCGFTSSCFCFCLDRSHTSWQGFVPLLEGCLQVSPVVIRVWPETRSPVKLRGLISPVCLSASCSGWTDRLAHLPLGAGHPEENRAGQGVLTAAPAGLRGAARIRTRAREEQTGRGSGTFVSPSSFCLPSDWARKRPRGFEFLLSFWKSTLRSVWIFFSTVKFKADRDRNVLTFGAGSWAERNMA